jgi:hypothetical protein
MAATQAKEDLVKLKLKRQMPITIEKTDVIPLMNYAWKRSFARKESNQKALCARGWNPLNYNLLLHPEIAATKTITAKPITANQAEPESSITMGVPTFMINLADLNTSSGIVAEQVDKILNAKGREESKERRKREREEGDKAQENLKNAKRVTAGIVFGNGTLISRKQILDKVKDKNDERAVIEAKKISDAQKRRAQLHRKVHSIIKAGKEYMEWTSSEVGIMLQYYKNADDPAMAKDVIGRRDQWLERRVRIPEALLPVEVIDAVLGPAGDTCNV